MSDPKSYTPKWLIVFLFLWTGSLLVAQDAEATGAFIVVSKEGDVKILDAEGQELPEGSSAPGQTLLQGQTIKTGPSGKIILLLSTGTLTTVEHSSQIILEKFTQKPFEQNEDTAVSDLNAEPSNSEVKLKLTQGAVVFNVKKLNTGSTFEIESPIGIAGIRGTDGELEVKLDPGTGNYTGGVNMLSGNVNFQTPGGANFDVTAGQGIQFQAAPNGQPIGQPQRKPVPPEKTQDLSQKTNVAKDSSKNVKVGEMNQARQDADRRVKNIKTKIGEKKAEKKPSDETKEENKDSPEEKPNQRNQEQKEDTRDAGKPESKEQTRAEKIQQKVKSVVGKKTGGDDTENKERLMETDDRQTLARQGIVLEDKEDAKKLQSLGLGKEDIKQLSKVSEEERKEILQSDDLADVKQQVQDRVNEQTANENIQTYTTEERQFMQALPDTIRVRLLTDLDPLVIQSIIAFNYTSEEILGFLNDLESKQVLDVSPNTSVPIFNPDSVADELIVPTEFLEILSNSDNINILTSLSDLQDARNGNILSDDLIELGKQANQLLQDTEPLGTLDSTRIYTYSQLENMTPFYDELVFMSESILDESGRATVPFYASRNLILQTSLDLSEIYETRGKSHFFITAAESIGIDGSINLSTGDTTLDTYLSILSAESINFSTGTTVRFSGDHLKVATAWENLEVINVSMEADVSLALESMQSSLYVRNSNLKTADEIMLRAAQELKLDSVQFSDQVREIYMQATTIDLSNVNFPGGSSVFLATKNGAIDGKYPTFPGNRQIGRVNFIENVQYNKNPLNNRIQFDQFGQNIHISTILP